jgi:hypothetical protein
MKQTAVEFLIEQIKQNVHNSFEEFELLIEQAKEIEKQQIIESRMTAPLLPSIDKSIYLNEAEQYYNETFNKEL